MNICYNGNSYSMTDKGDRSGRTVRFSNDDKSLNIHTNPQKLYIIRKPVYQGIQKLTFKYLHCQWNLTPGISVTSCWVWPEMLFQKGLLHLETQEYFFSAVYERTHYFYLDKLRKFKTFQSIWQKSFSKLIVSKNGFFFNNNKFNKTSK